MKYFIISYLKPSQITIKIAHINEVNFNLINFNNLPIINNERIINDNQWDIGWVIDRTPDYNLINNNEYDDINFVNNIRNERNLHFHEQFARATQALINGTIQFRNNEDIDDYGDDFIPFEPLPHPPIDIEVEVQQFYVTEEDTNCCVCMETRENQQICQLNCLHKFCSECILTHIRRNRHQTCCPLCRTNITNISVQTQQIRETFII